MSEYIQLVHDHLQRRTKIWIRGLAYFCQFCQFFDGHRLGNFPEQIPQGIDLSCLGNATFVPESFRSYVRKASHILVKVGGVEPRQWPDIWRFDGVTHVDDFTGEFSRLGLVDYKVIRLDVVVQPTASLQLR